MTIHYENYVHYIIYTERNTGHGFERKQGCRWEKMRGRKGKEKIMQPYFNFNLKITIWTSQEALKHTFQ